MRVLDLDAPLAAPARFDRVTELKLKVTQKTMAGAFAKMAAAKPTGGGNNIRDGIYTFIVERLFHSNGHNGECIIAEFRVKESSSNGAVDEHGRPVTPNAPGTACSAVWNLTQHEAAAGNSVAFAMIATQSLMGLDWQAFLAMEVDGQKAFPGGAEQALAWLCGSDNPLAGVEVRDETYRFVNKGRKNPANAGKQMTGNKWFPVDMTQEQIDANKKLLTTTTAKADTGMITPAASAPAASAPAAPAPASPALAGILNRARGGK